MTHLCHKFLLLITCITFLLLEFSITQADETNILRSSDLSETNNGNSRDLAGLEERDSFKWPWSLDGDAIYIQEDESDENIYLGEPNNTTILQETNQQQSGGTQRVRFLFPLTD